MACPSFVGGGAAQVVQDVFAAQRGYADKYYGLLQSAVNSYLEALQDLPNIGIETTIDWPNISIGAAFQKPTPPTAFSETFRLPDDPISVEISTPAGPVFVSYPTSPTKPALDLAGLPDPWEGEIPTDIPEVEVPEFPDAPVIEFPTAPTLQNIPIPEMPVLDLPVFSGVRPNTDVEIPGLVYPEEEIPYSSENLTALQNQILTVLQGNRGYLDSIWDAIWAREQRNEIEEMLSAEESVMEMWAARGWFAPPGMAAEQLLKIRQGTLNNRITRARELAIEQNKQEVERFNFHVSQGIALESQLITYSSQQAERALKAVEIFNDASIKLLEAKISRINILLEAYKTDAQVYRDRLAGELAKVQILEAEIKAAALIGEIDERKVRLYLGLLDGVGKQIDIYNSQLQSVNIFLDVSKTKIQAAVERIKAAMAQLEAKKLEYDGYDSKIRGQLGVANIWQTEGQIFVARTNAISQQNRDQVALFEGYLNAERLKLEQLQADYQRFKAEVDAETGRFDALAKVYGHKVNLYSAQNEGEKARMLGESEKYKALTEHSRAIESLRLKQAEIEINQLMRKAEIEINGLEKIMVTYAQIGSAAMAAIDAQAGISGSDSTDTNYNYTC